MICNTEYSCASDFTSVPSPRSTYINTKLENVTAFSTTDKKYNKLWLMYTIKLITEIASKLTFL